MRLTGDQGRNRDEQRLEWRDINHDKAKRAFCLAHDAVGVINRNNFRIGVRCRIR